MKKPIVEFQLPKIVYQISCFGYVLGDDEAYHMWSKTFYSFDAANSCVSIDCGKSEWKPEWDKNNMLSAGGCEYHLKELKMEDA